jgi:hypothetical protein
MGSGVLPARTAGLTTSRPWRRAARARRSRARSCVTSQRAPWAKARSTKTWSSGSEHSGPVVRWDGGTGQALDQRSKAAQHLQQSPVASARAGAYDKGAHQLFAHGRAGQPQHLRPTRWPGPSRACRASLKTSQSRTALVSRISAGTGIGRTFVIRHCAPLTCRLSPVAEYNGRLFGNFAQCVHSAARRPRPSLSSGPGVARKGMGIEKNAERPSTNSAREHRRRRPGH